jgi:hypothetical protein
VASWRRAQLGAATAAARESGHLDSLFVSAGSRRTIWPSGLARPENNERERAGNLDLAGAAWERPLGLRRLSAPLSTARTSESDTH